MTERSGSGDGTRGPGRTVRTLAAASFLNDMGSDMIYPIWPLFVTQFMGANMAVLGLLDGLGDALVSISKAFSGYISDRVGRRKVFIWTGYLMGSLSRVGYALSPAWGWLIPFRILDRSGKIRSSPRDALVAEASLDSNRGRNFGLLRSMDHLGAVVGILLAALLFSYLGYTRLFLIAALPSLAASALIIIRIRERRALKGESSPRISFGRLPRSLKLFFLVGGIFSLASFSYSFLLMFSLGSEIGEGGVPFLYLIFTATASVVSIWFGKLSDSIGRIPVMAFSFLLWIAVCLLFLFHAGLWMIIAAFVVYGLHKGSLEPVRKTIVSELAPDDMRASTLGGYQMLIGLAALPSSLAAGIIWEAVSPGAPFVISIVLTLASLLLLMVMWGVRGRGASS